ncbi:MAG: hypothetical protein J7619_30970 [Dyadobacter sp.]|uniref:hypothetical protein n=1 Tax=Dyadobacter sp. TaxID=1914288 RepID=UPI001B2D29C3|nr:hypothetical protein [Dyadobacter sp.]MBO9617149.1 hypothetical protein [Dyadobacter sp.]
MRYLYTFIIGILPALESGQDAVQKGHFEYGVFGGKQLWGKIYDDRKMEAVSGWVGGIDLGYRDKSGISFHLQPNYSTFGSILEEGKNTQVYLWRKWNWYAINVPLTVRYTLSSGKIRPFAEVGLNLRLRTKITMKYDGYGCGVVGCYGSEGIDDVQRSTTKDPAGLVAAIGAEIDVLSVTIPVSIRLNESFGTFGGKPDSTPGSSYGTLKTRVVQVTAGISIP